MITVAVPESKATPDLFFLDMREVPWDASAGVTLTAARDGQEMAATQSHAMSFKAVPATRIAWPKHITELPAASLGSDRR
jgi:hypothetical protein